MPAGVFSVGGHCHHGNSKAISPTFPASPKSWPSTFGDHRLFHGDRFEEDLVEVPAEHTYSAQGLTSHLLGVRSERCLLQVNLKDSRRKPSPLDQQTQHLP